MNSRKSGTNNSLVIWIGLAMMLAGVIVALQLQQPPPAPALQQATLMPTPKPLQPFSLIDDDGKPFDGPRLKNQWHLVFFGYTHCPDICPTALSDLNATVKLIARETPAAPTPQVVFVSVDPERDTPQRLKSYVPYFNPDFTGVTGDFLDIHRFATALNTPFRKVPGQDENYQVDHSANVVLINPRGDYHGFFKAPLDLAKMKVTYRSARVMWDRQGN